MSAPLILPQESLEKHLSAVGQVLNGVVDPAAHVQLDADWNFDPVVAGLVGKGCEVAARNRGFDAQVVPLLSLRGGLWAWLGYREEWAHEHPAGATKRFSFRSAGMTIHFGYRNIRHKPQMFRAEWAGWARWTRSSELGFQAGAAAHPHWQFDALESLTTDVVADTAETLLAVLRHEAEDVGAREFSPHGITDQDIGGVVGAQELSRIHFASAAAWWRSSPNDAHAHAPKDTAELQAWIRQTLAYIIGELGRLQAA